MEKEEKITVFEISKNKIRSQEIQHLLSTGLQTGKWADTYLPTLQKAKHLYIDITRELEDVPLVSESLIPDANIRKSVTKTFMDSHKRKIKEKYGENTDYIYEAYELVNKMCEKAVPDDKEIISLLKYLRRI